MKVLSPQTKEEFKQYYHIRWITLRKPWGKPVGSERLKDDKEAIHAMLVDDGVAIGVARGHFNTPEEGQIRLMGVVEKYRKKGAGSILLEGTEKMLWDAGAKRIVIHSRDYAMKFYEKNGYVFKQKSYLLYGEIQHFKLEKSLR